MNLRLLTLMTFVLLIGVGCQNGDNEQADMETNEENSETAEVEEDWTPRTVTFEDQEVHLEEPPTKIAALSLDTAQTILTLTSSERLAVAPESIENEALSHFTNEVENIDGLIPGATNLDPEEVLAYDPDLILLTATHGEEEDAVNFFEDADIPSLVFEDWDEISKIQEQMTVIAEAIGEEEANQSFIEEMETVEEETSDAISDSPTVMAVSQVGSTTGPFVLGSSNIAYDIMSHTGAVSASDELGYDDSAPITIEEILDLDPDYIVLVNWGEVSEEFQELIDSPGWDTLTAAQEDRIIEMDAKEVMSPNPFVMDAAQSLVDFVENEQ